jgi:hypothetical protein
MCQVEMELIEGQSYAVGLIQVLSSISFIGLLSSIYLKKIQSVPDKMEL